MDLGKKLIFVLLAFLLGCSSKPTTTPVVVTPPLPKMPAGWSWECHPLKSVQSGQYCIHTKGIPTKTIWYAHGLGCSQDILQNPASCFPKSPGIFEKAFIAGLDNVKIVTFSYGKEWMLDPFMPKYMNNPDATTDAVKNRLIPEILQRFDLPKPWQAVGHSLGGYNLSQLIISYPEMFDRVVLMHPMIPDCDPFAFGVGIKCIGGILLVGSEFSETKWKTMVNPLLRIRSAIKIPRTLVTTCMTDEFKLVEGPRQFVAQGNISGLTLNLLNYGSCTHYSPHADVVLEFLGRI